MERKIFIFDSTLRDGAQAESISYSIEDKWKIVLALDELGIDYIEAGNPGSNPKDLEFFNQIKTHQLKQAKITGFGSTRRKGMKVEDDANNQLLLDTDSTVVTIVGKSWDLHVKDVINTSLDENLDMIGETVAFFKKKGKEVIFDAEHFFDGFKSNPKYAFDTLQAAADGGADWLILCETNGGVFPGEVYEITKNMIKKFSLPVGIHCHNDCGMAVANSMMAVEAGATQVQGTFIGFGERCGNANLSTTIPNLQLKKDYECITGDQLIKLTSTARMVAEVSNIPLDNYLPYVGKSAFAHKGGMHVDGVIKVPRSFEHVKPDETGNERRFLMSEVSGRSTILEKIQKVSPELKKNSKQTQSIIDMLKKSEHDGYQFEGAESSFELMIRKHLGKYQPFFQLESFTIISEQSLKNGNSNSSAIIKVNVDGEEEITASEGDGPVNALDRALRKALEVFYPELKDVHLTDFKVRVLNPEEATAAKVRVLIESTDGKNIWTTVGVSTDILQASCIALVDSIEYKLMKNIEKKFKIFA
jgi:2-isopropylmalate synthase